MSHVRVVVLAAAFLLVAAVPGVRAKTGLNDTGSTICRLLDNSGDGPCAGTRQDGDVGRDFWLPKPKDGFAGFSFAKVCGNGELAGKGSCPGKPQSGTAANQWRCTQDRVTGLMWEVKRQGREAGLFHMNALFSRLRPGEPGYVSTRDPATLIALANTQAMCGRQDWRLPKVNELESILHYGVKSPGPTADAGFFPRTVAAPYWSEQLSASSPDRAWVADFSVGIITGTARRDESLRVQMVSRPATVGTMPGENLVASPEGDTVIDAAAGLVWQRCSYGQTWNGSTCVGVPATFNRKDALTLNAVLPGGWRLPNVKELRTVVDVTRAYPAFDPGLFPNTSVEGPYWSSTPLDGFATYLWYVASGGGGSHYDFHSLGSLLLVRDLDK